MASMRLRWQPKIYMFLMVKNEAIHGVSLDFERFKITALIGASGSGKSTYLTFFKSNE
jgi:ABC-type phosphate transport system ATPase subunit